MKKITSINEYPFIDMLKNGMINGNIGGWIKTENAEKADKNFDKKYVGDNLEMDADLGAVKATYLDEGFINGYITAMKIIKGMLL